MYRFSERLSLATYCGSYFLCHRSSVLMYCLTLSGVHSRRAKPQGSFNPLMPIVWRLSIQCQMYDLMRSQPSLPYGLASSDKNCLTSVVGADPMADSREADPSPQPSGISVGASRGAELDGMGGG